METIGLKLCFSDLDEDEKARELSPEVEQMLARSKEIDENFRQLRAVLERNSGSRAQIDTWKLRPRFVLLVEDNLADILMVREALQECPVEVTLRLAADGEHAISALEELQPDLILLDLTLPGLDGFDVLRHCQVVSAPVVVFTSSQSEADRARALSLGASGYFVKPKDTADFFATVCGIVQNCFA